MCRFDTSINISRCLFCSQEASAPLTCFFFIFKNTVESFEPFQETNTSSSALRWPQIFFDQWVSPAFVSSFRDVSLFFCWSEVSVFVSVEDSGTMNGSSWWYKWTQTHCIFLLTWRRENWWLTTLKKKKKISKRLAVSRVTSAGQTFVLNLFWLLSSLIFCSIKVMLYKLITLMRWVWTWFLQNYSTSMKQI